MEAFGSIARARIISDYHASGGQHRKRSYPTAFRSSFRRAGCIPASATCSTAPLASCDCPHRQPGVHTAFAIAAQIRRRPSRNRRPYVRTRATLVQSDVWCPLIDARLQIEIHHHLPALPPRYHRYWPRRSRSQRHLQRSHHRFMLLSINVLHHPGCCFRFSTPKRIPGQI